MPCGWSLDFWKLVFGSLLVPLGTILIGVFSNNVERVEEQVPTMPLGEVPQIGREEPNDATEPPNQAPPAVSPPPAVVGILSEVGQQVIALCLYIRVSCTPGWVPPCCDLSMVDGCGDADSETRRNTLCVFMLTECPARSLPVALPFCGIAGASLGCEEQPPVGTASAAMSLPPPTGAPDQPVAAAAAAAPEEMGEREEYISDTELNMVFYEAVYEAQEEYYTAPVPPLPTVADSPEIGEMVAISENATAVFVANSSLPVPIVVPGESIVSQVTGSPGAIVAVVLGAIALAIGLVLLVATLLPWWRRRRAAQAEKAGTADVPVADAIQSAPMEASNV